MSSQRIRAKYLIETAHSLEEAAMVIAGEQSCGTFVSVPGETEELRNDFFAQIDSITELENVSSPTLPGSKPPPGNVDYKRAVIEISWPFHNVGANLSNLMATVAGNLYELSPFSGLKLLDVEIPLAF